MIQAPWSDTLGLFGGGVSEEENNSIASTPGSDEFDPPSASVAEIRTKLSTV
jgi:hypothetical protein